MKILSRLKKFKSFLITLLTCLRDKSIVPYAEGGNFIVLAADTYRMQTPDDEYNVFISKKSEDIMKLSTLYASVYRKTILNELKSKESKDLKKLLLKGKVSDLILYGVNLTKNDIF